MSNVGDFFGVDFSGTVLKFRKRKKYLSSLVYVLLQSESGGFSRRSRARTAKKKTKKCDARAKLFA